MDQREQLLNSGLSYVFSSDEIEKALENVVLTEQSYTPGSNIVQ